MNGSALALLHDDQALGDGIAATLSHYLKTAVHALPSKASNDFVRNFSDAQHSSRSLHDVPSSMPHEYGAQEMDRASERVRRNPTPARTEVEHRLISALAEAMPQYQRPAKTIAAEIGTSTATVEALRQRIPEAMVTLVMLGRAMPGFGLEIVDAMGIDIDGDRAAFAKFLEMQRFMQGRAK